MSSGWIVGRSRPALLGEAGMDRSECNGSPPRSCVEVEVSAAG